MEEIKGAGAGAEVEILVIAVLLPLDTDENRMIRGENEGKQGEEGVLLQAVAVPVSVAQIGAELVIVTKVIHLRSHSSSDMNKNDEIIIRMLWLVTKSAATKIEMIQ